MTYLKHTLKMLTFIFQESESGAPTPTLETKHRERGSRLGNISGTENLARQGRKMSIKTDLPHKDLLLAR